jgi:hypothetical protein
VDYVNLHGIRRSLHDRIETRRWASFGEERQVSSDVGVEIAN